MPVDCPATWPGCQRWGKSWCQSQHLSTSPGTHGGSPAPDTHIAAGYTHTHTLEDPQFKISFFSFKHFSDFAVTFLNPSHKNNHETPTWFGGRRKGVSGCMFIGHWHLYVLNLTLLASLHLHLNINKVDWEKTQLSTLKLEALLYSFPDTFSLLRVYQIESWYVCVCVCVCVYVCVCVCARVQTGRIVFDEFGSNSRLIQSSPVPKRLFNKQ